MNPQENNQQISANWSHIKSEGQQRTQRIGQIFQAAFSDTKSEFQSGFHTIRPLAQDITTTVVDDLKRKGAEAATQVNNAWTDQSDHPDLVARVVAFIKALLGDRPEQVATQMRQQANRLDTNFTQRYGGRYQAAKQQFHTVKTWYINATGPQQTELALETLTQSSTAPTTIVDVNATEVELPR